VTNESQNPQAISGTNDDSAKTQKTIRLAKPEVFGVTDDELKALAKDLISFCPEIQGFKLR
jgi:hypothetical protein